MDRDSRLQKHYQNSHKNDHHVAFRWKDLKYSIYQRNTQTSTLLQTNYTEKCILNNLNGVVESKQLVAILGPTGKRPDHPLLLMQT
jgi:ABC-type multidrug transport system ATPase subunit